MSVVNPNAPKKPKAASPIEKLETLKSLIAVENEKFNTIQEIIKSHFSQAIAKSDGNWDLKTLEDVCDKASSNISQNQIMENSGEYSIYGASGLIRKIDFYHQEKEYIAIVKDGAGIGRVMLLEPKSSVIGTLQYLIPKPKVDATFLYYFLIGVDFLKYKTGSTIPHIYFKDYCKEPIAIPDYNEQKKIVKELRIILKEIDDVASLLESKRQELNEFRNSILHSVFSFDYSEQSIDTLE